MKFIAPAAILVAALIALIGTPQGEPLLGLSHDDFGRGAFGVAMLVWLAANGLARAGVAGAMRVFSGVALWIAVAMLLVGVYAYRAEFSDFGDRVLAELNPSAAQIGPGGEVTVRRRLGGEFVVPGKVNGARTSFVFDTGATSVVLTADDARAARISAGDYEVAVVTANGETRAAPVQIDKLEVGDIAVRDVAALVARPGSLGQSLLGMSFLERLKGFGVEGGKLVLRGK